MTMSKKDIKKKKLILYDDEVNHVDDVIFALIYVFGYLHMQAQQIDLLVHVKGSFCLKEDTVDELNTYKQELDKFNLKTKIK